MSTEKSVSDIGKRFLFVREQIAKVNQREFGATLGIAQNTLSDIENGKRRPKLPLIRTVSYLFAINEHWLLTGEGEMYSGGPSPGSTPGSCCIAGQAELPRETRDLLAMAVEVLTSGTKYARLLAEQVRSLHESIEFTKRIETLEDDLAENRRITCNALDRLEALESAERERIKGQETGRVDREETTP